MTARELTELERTLPAQPIGTIITYAGTDIPDGYLALDGSELSETVYSALFAKLGTTWNTTGGVASPAVGNFRLPPSEIGGLGLYFRGEGATNGVVGTYQADALKSHLHGMVGYSSDLADSDGAVNGGGSGRNDFNTKSTGDATETRPRSITVKYCIKY